MSYSVENLALVGDSIDKITLDKWSNISDQCKRMEGVRQILRRMGYN